MPFRSFSHDGVTQKQIAASTKMKLRPGRVLLISLLILFAVAVMVAVREYLLLRSIERALVNTPEPAKPGAEKQSPAPEKPRYVQSVRREADGAVIRARVNFAAFKRAVEANPAQLSAWGSVGWKVLDDTPALCLKRLASESPFTPLGVQKGDCITHLDGETVNQPMRNLGIWLTLGSRKALTVDTLRDGEKIRYYLQGN